MVHRIQEEPLQVGNIAGDVKRENLSGTTVSVLVATGKALEDQDALDRSIAIADNILTSSHPTGRHGQRYHCLFLLIGERCGAL